jgi:hypothetical protein
MATIEELENGLRKAHAAGNADHARAFANEIRRMREAGPDFSNVQGQVQTQQEMPRMEDGWERGAARSTMLGARSVIEGGAGLIGALGGDALVHAGNWLGEKGPTTKSLITGEQERRWPREAPWVQKGSMLADKIGLPTPQTGSERVSADIGRGLTGTALTMGAGSLAQGGGQVAQRVGNFLTAQPRLQAASTATGSGAAGLTRESGGSEGAQVLAGLAGGLSPGVASFGTSATLRGLVRGRSGEQMQRTIDDFRAVGATPSVGQASGNRAIQGGENLLAGGPTSAGVMNRFATRQAEDIGSGLQQRAAGLSRSPSRERAGRAVERGADTFAQNVRAQRTALYNVADQLIPETTQLPMANTQRVLGDMTRLTPGAESTTAVLVNPRIREIANTLGADLEAARLTGQQGIPYSAVRELRSRIGEELSDFALAPDRPTAQYRRLYGALSQDLEEAARQQGPAAERAARRANNYTRASSDRLEQVQRVVDKNGGPEKVYAAVMAGAKDGGTTLRAVMQSLPPEGQRAVTAAVIRRMGMARAGAQDASGEVFSADTFLTKWNNDVSDEAKRALFDRYGPQFSRDMDRIARVSSNLKEGSKVFANPSGTANRAASMTYGASLVGSLFTGGTPLLVGGGVAANVLARALTNPQNVRRLAAITALPVGAVPAAIQSMRVAADRDGDEGMRQLADLLEQQQNETSSTSGQ